MVRKTFEFDTTGKTLFGDNFSFEQIRQWYREEEVWHDQFIGGRTDEYWSIYETFNHQYVLKNFFSATSETSVLSFGCAEGVDLKKTYQSLDFQLFGIESSDELIEEFRRRFPAGTVRKATIDGSINFRDDFFDYAICFGVLHHVPNVSYLLSELYRVVKPGGFLIIREPVSSMGFAGQSSNRKGMSPNERGIPIEWMKINLQRVGFNLILVRSAYYAPLIAVIKRLPILWSLPKIIYWVDRLVCKLPYTKRYVRSRWIDKFAPGSGYYVASKD